MRFGRPVCEVCLLLVDVQIASKGVEFEVEFLGDGRVGEGFLDYEDVESVRRRRKSRGRGWDFERRDERALDGRKAFGLGGWVMMDSFFRHREYTLYPTYPCVFVE